MAKLNRIVSHAFTSEGHEQRTSPAKTRIQACDAAATSKTCLGSSQMGINFYRTASCLARGLVIFRTPLALGVPRLVANRLDSVISIPIDFGRNKSRFVTRINFTRDCLRQARPSKLALFLYPFEIQRIGCRASTKAPYWNSNNVGFRQALHRWISSRGLSGERGHFCILQRHWQEHLLRPRETRSRNDSWSSSGRQIKRTRKIQLEIREPDSSSV